MKVLTTALLVFCSSASFGIIDGSAVRSGDPVSKHVALLVASTGKGTAFCSSTIIGDDLLLTAAHCLKGTRAKQVMAIFALGVTIKDLGNRNWMSSRIQDHTIIPVENYKIHPGYSPSETKSTKTMMNAVDLAVVKLAQPVPAGYSPVSIYNGSTPKGGAVTVAGYGMTRRNQTNKNDFQLRDTTIEVTDVYPKIFVRSAPARGDRGAVCEGDSGGPAFAQISGDLELVGTTIISSCDGNGLNLDVFERDGYFQSWVQSAVAELNSGTSAVDLASR